jgi:hypothetical protein
MLLKKMATMATAVALVAGSVAPAVAAPAVAAQPLSLANAPGVRASAETGVSNRLNGDDTTTQILALAGVALVILAIVLLLDDDIDLVQPIPPNSP